MKTDSGFQMRSYYCFVEWITTCSNQVEYVLKLYSDDKDAVSSIQTFDYFPSQFQGFQSLSYQAQGVLIRQIYPSMFSLAKTVLTSLLSELTLLAGETNTVVLEEAILGEEKSYPKLSRSEADF